jgi:hypothetical protein
VASLIPELPSEDGELHFVLCDFGRDGLAFVETDPAAASRDEIVHNLMVGEYRQPMRVIAVDVDHGTARDVSRDVAHAVEQAVEQETLAPATRAFLIAHRRHASA